MKKEKAPTLTIGQYLDAVFSEKYDEKKISKIKKWQTTKRSYTS